jgi:exonuclease SbcC
MTIKLISEELWNIRAHEHFIFAPDSTGITAIDGSNGKGKSTIVDSLAWALYGTKPEGVSKVSQIMRDSADLGKDKFAAIVILEVDNEQYKIERRIVSKKGAVECEIWRKDKETNEWVSLAGPAVSHSEPYIRKVLNMDESGFLSAILVQQKQVDQLISAPPRTRAEVIEKLTGISSITTALIEARQEQNSLKKAASISSVDDSVIESLEEDLKNSESDLSKQKEILDEKKESLKVLKKHGEELKNKVSEESEKREKLNSLQGEIAVNEALLSEKKKELELLVKQKQSQKRKLDSRSFRVSVKDIEADLRKKKEIAHSNHVEIKVLEDKQSALQSSIEEYEEALKSYSAKEKKSFAKLIKDSEEQKELLKAQFTDLQSASISIKAEISSIENAIEVISGHGGKCPTCLQEVSDVSAAIKSLEKEKESLQSKRLENIEAAKVLNARVKEENEKFEKLQKASEALSSLDKTKELLKASGISLDSLRADKLILDKEVSALEKNYREALHYSETQEEYDRLLERAQSVSDFIESTARRIESAKTDLESLNALKETSFKKLSKELEESREEYQKEYTDFSESRTSCAVLTEKVKNTSEKISKAKEEMKKYKELLKSVEISAGTTSLIEEFRENRIKTSIPIIEIYASDLLNRFTEGAFTQLKLDEKFNATVTLSNGSERSVGLLSGGELSAAAISLRLAIAMLLNNGDSENLIILDEVLVSQDSNRSEIILSTIKEVCKGQVIIIAHNDNIDSIADNVVQL